MEFAIAVVAASVAFWWWSARRAEARARRVAKRNPASGDVTLEERSVREAARTAQRTEPSRSPATAPPRHPSSRRRRTSRWEDQTRTGNWWTGGE